VTPFSVVAIIAAFNEADIIGQVVGDLVGQGVGVYVLDHGSTDGTVAALEPYVGHGVIAVERFPKDADAATGDADRFTWERILRRKEALAWELDATWFIHHDADEFRESPWGDVSFLEGIRHVDAAGYNAIDFAVLNFWPIHDEFRSGDDVRQAFPFYERGRDWDRVQIRCWKKVEGPVDLASSGGHEACFPGRKVFPIRFLLRHYPIRSQAHGARKVFVERRPRFLSAERERGWHVQYDAFREGVSFLRDPTTLTPWDPDAVRLELTLRHRGVEELEEALALAGRDLGRACTALESRAAEIDGLRGDLAMRAIEAVALQRAVDTRDEVLQQLRGDLAMRAAEAVALQREVDTRGEELRQLRGNLDTRATQAVALQREVDTRGEELKQLRGDLATRSAETVSLQREIHARGKELERLRAAVGELGRRLEDVYASRSWRLTAPLRRGLRFVRGY
jgi:hypothetical protein